MTATPRAVDQTNIDAIAAIYETKESSTAGVREQPGFN